MDTTASSFLNLIAEFLLTLPATAEASVGGMLERLRAIIAEPDQSAFSAGMRVAIAAGPATLLPNENSNARLARAGSVLYAPRARCQNRSMTIA